MLVLNFVGMRVDARQVRLVLAVRSTDQGAVLCLLYLDLAAARGTLNDMLGRLRSILQVRDLGRRLAASLPYSLDRGDDLVLLLSIRNLLLIS